MTAKSLTILATLFLAFGLGGCTRESPASAAQPPTLLERFRLVVTTDGRALRLDTQTGQVALVTDKGVTTLRDDRRIQLEVGQVYVLENGELVAYQGNQKFGSAVDALVKNYSGERKAP